MWLVCMRSLVTEHQLGVLSRRYIRSKYESNFVVDRSYFCTCTLFLTYRAHKRALRNEHVGARVHQLHMVHLMGSKEVGAHFVDPYNSHAIDFE